MLPLPGLLDSGCFDLLSPVEALAEAVWDFYIGQRFFLGRLTSSFFLFQFLALSLLSALLTLRLAPLPFLALSLGQFLILAVFALAALLAILIRDVKIIFIFFITALHD